MHILNSPAEFVQLVRSRLLNLDQVYEYDETLDSLSDLLSFTISYSSREEHYNRASDAFPWGELLDTFIDCVMIKPVWIEWGDQVGLCTKLQVTSLVPSMYFVKPSY